MPSAAGRKDFVLQRKIWFTAGYKFATGKLVLSETLLNTFYGSFTDVKLYSRDGVIWMSQQQMALLFDTSKQNISLHILNILQDKELYEKSVVKDYLTTAGDGKNYNITYYALPMVIAVGFRVRSLRRIYNARKRIPTKI